jgi:hypothetical protein
MMQTRRSSVDKGFIPTNALRKAQCTSFFHLDVVQIRLNMYEDGLKKEDFGTSAHALNVRDRHRMSWENADIRFFCKLCWAEELCSQNMQQENPQEHHQELYMSDIGNNVYNVTHVTTQQ